MFENVEHASVLRCTYFFYSQIIPPVDHIGHHESTKVCELIPWHE